MSDAFPLHHVIPKELILIMGAHCPIVYYKFLISSKAMFKMLEPFESVLEASWVQSGQTLMPWKRPLHAKITNDIICDIQIVRDNIDIKALHIYNILSDRQLHGKYEVFYGTETQEIYNYKMGYRHGEFMIKLGKNATIIGNYLWNKLHGTLIYLFDVNELHYIYEYGNIKSHVRFESCILKYIHHCNNNVIETTETYSKGVMEKITRYGEKIIVEYYYPDGQLMKTEYYEP